MASLDYEVLAITREKSELGRLSSIPELKLASCDAGSWATEVNSFKADALLLLDWSGVANSERNSTSQYENLDRLSRILSELEAPEVVIGIGSQAELGPCSGPISDSRLDNPTTLYGRAKVQARTALFEYGQQSGKDVRWGRIFSTYGPLDNPDWFIPSMIDSLMNNNPFAMTKGEQNWSYLHAFDAARGFVTMLERGHNQGIQNIGHPKTELLSELANMVENKLGKTGLIRLGEVPYREDQVMELSPKCETLVAQGWNPRIGLSEGLESVIDYMKNGSFDLFQYVIEHAVN